MHKNMPEINVKPPKYPKLPKLLSIYAPRDKKQETSASSAFNYRDAGTLLYFVNTYHRRRSCRFLRPTPSPSS